MGRPRTPSPGPSLSRGGSGSSSDSPDGGQPSLNNPGGSSRGVSLNNPGGGSSPGSLTNPDGVSSPGSLTSPGGTPDAPDRNPTPDKPSTQPSGSNANPGADSPPDTIKSDLLDGEVSFQAAKGKDSYLRSKDENVAVALRSGKKAQFDLELVLATGKADKHTDLTWEEVLRRYTVDGTPDTLRGPMDSASKEPIAHELQGLAARIGAIEAPENILVPKFTSFTWRNEKETMNPSMFVQQGLYSPDCKTIVGQIAFSRYDLLSKEDGRLKMSELRWQSWVKASTDEGKDPKDLEFFLMHNIEGENGKDVAERIFERGNVGPETPAIKEITPADGDLWAAILGTDNLKGLLYMMGDHHHQLGNKKPQKVYLERAVVSRPLDSDAGSDSESEIDVVINMGMVIG